MIKMTNKDQVLQQIDQETMTKLLVDQQDEINSYHIYSRLAKVVEDEHNSRILLDVAKDEMKHYQVLKKLTGKDLKAQKWHVFFFFWMIRIFGLTFGIKILEKGESTAQGEYKELEKYSKEMVTIIEDEEKHEHELINMIDEERLNYMGSVVLGLNDALVELTGALAGYTFAFQDSKLIALTGLITGISASFSMAASEYLSTRQEGGDNAGKSSLYTGIAYVLTVIFLVLPYILIPNPFISLGVSLGVAVLIIFVFNYYISVAKDYNFFKRFSEMAVISLGVAGISFLIGVLIKQFIGIDI